MRKIVLLCGGRSAEHDVSLQSAASIIAHLDRTRYRIEALGIARNGEVIHPSDLRQALVCDPSEGIEFPAAEGGWISYLSGHSQDVLVFPILHGPCGEDGTVQGLLELLDLPYVGAGVAGSAVAMNKIFCKRILRDAGLPVLPWVDFHVDRYAGKAANLLPEIVEKLQFPLFVKPANMGSSVGISRCMSERELEEGLAQAYRFDEWVLVEQGIEAREIEVSVLGRAESCEISVPGEIVPSDDFYSYRAKYLDGQSSLIIPAGLDAPVADRIRHLAGRVFSELQLTGMARVDFLLDDRKQEIWINEPNTIPGFTSISMYPKLWSSSGLDYSELLDQLVELAFRAHRERQRYR